MELNSFVGKVVARSEKEGRVVLTVTNRGGGKLFLSYFKNDQYMPPDVAEKLNAIQMGDEGEFGYTSKPGKDGKTYSNLKAFMPHVQSSAERQSAREATGATQYEPAGADEGEQSNRVDYLPDVEKLVGTCTSYAMELEKVSMTSGDPAGDDYGVTNFERVKTCADQLCQIELDLIQKYRK